MMANSKSGVQLDPIKGAKGQLPGSKMMQSASIESFQRRPVSGISKGEGSQSRFRQSQNQFNNGVEARSNSDTGNFQGQFHQRSGQ